MANIKNTRFIIGIDAGTTGIRIFCFDAKGRVISSAYSEFGQIYPKPGWVEHDPEEIWNVTRRLLGKAVADGGLKSENAVAIGITNQRETTVLFDRSGKPVYNAIVWQCRRTADICNNLKKRNLEQRFRNKTGLVLDAYFSGTKIKWILDNVKGLRKKAIKGDVLFGTVDTWLLYKLTGGESHKTDYTNASRTLIYNIKDKKWDQELLKILDIPEQVLPEVLPSAGFFGKVKNVKGLADGIPVASMVGDQQGALFGQMCTSPGEAKNTYGTGCFLLMNTGSKFMISRAGLITTLACGPAGEPVYALEGSVFIAGAVIQFLRDNFDFFKSSSESEKMARNAGEEDDLVFVPAFAGLGAPYWNMDARGAIFGLTRDTTKEQIVRSALKSVALQSLDLVRAMEKDTGKKMKSLRVDGGVSSNSWLMQYQADILKIPVSRPENTDTTVLGAAYLAGLHTGFFKSLAELKKLHKTGKSYRPGMKNRQVNRETALWKKAVEKLVI